MSSTKIALGKLKMLEEQLGRIEWEVSKCKEWAKGIRTELKAIEDDLFWGSYPSEAEES